MKVKTETILLVMNILTWIAFVGLMVQAGIMLVSYSIGLINTEFATKLYMPPDTTLVTQSMAWLYCISALFMSGIVVLKALAAYQVIEILEKLNLVNPFTSEISKRIGRMSYVVLWAGILAVISEGFHNWLNHRGLSEAEGADPGEFIFLACVLFIVAQIFKKGVELQSDNELTI